MPKHVDVFLSKMNVRLSSTVCELVFNLVSRENLLGVEWVNAKNDLFTQN